MAALIRPNLRLETCQSDAAAVPPQSAPRTQFPIWHQTSQTPFCGEVMPDAHRAQLEPRHPSGDRERGDERTVVGIADALDLTISKIVEGI